IEFKSILTPERIRSIVSIVPDDWIKAEWLESPDEVRAVYSQFLETRIAASDIFVKEAKHARE
ncbi:MAG: HipA family kinase, partial [Mucilaginibacter sp.]